MQRRAPSMTTGVSLALAAVLAAACGPPEDSADRQSDSSSDARAEDGGRGMPSMDGSTDRSKTGDASSGGSPDPGMDAPDAGATASGGGCASFDSAFAAIQKVIFEKRGCTASTCHGEAQSGGLDLRPDVAYENLIDVPSSNSHLARVRPGTATDSYLYEKLRAGTDPESVDVAGSPMPVGTAPLTPAELEAVQLWIIEGAPETGSVSDPVEGTDVGSLLDACLPSTGPVPVTPLEPPDPEEGIQFVLPEYVLEAGTEVENCTPFAYDFTNEVPAQYKDEARNVMYVKSSRVRQDPVSHHMVVWNPGQDLTTLASNDPEWTCRGGPDAGAQCDPTQGSDTCGEKGVCGGPTTDGTLCGVDTSGLASAASGTGTADPFATLGTLLELLASGGMPEQIANTQSAQQYLPPMDGVYWEIPLRGVLWFNSHAFNLSEEDTTLHARMNFHYADERERQMIAHNEIRNSVPVGQAPFTRETYCEDYVVPQNHSIAIMTGHTHRRGVHFEVTDPSGETIYENFDYDDPEYTRYDPWLEFPSADPAQRTLEFCATFNNGVEEDGSPDVQKVTRASRMPEGTSCTPVACVAGDVGASCTTDSDCDSTADAGDGVCDACSITGGTTTENEMFVLMPWLIQPAQN